MDIWSGMRGNVIYDVFCVSFFSSLLLLVISHFSSLRYTWLHYVWRRWLPCLSLTFDSQTVARGMSSTLANSNLKWFANGLLKMLWFTLADRSKRSVVCRTKMSLYMILILVFWPFTSFKWFSVRLWLLFEFHSRKQQFSFRFDVNRFKHKKTKNIYISLGYYGAQQKKKRIKAKNRWNENVTNVTVSNVHCTGWSVLI